MTTDDLTPAERKEVQTHIVRCWRGRRRRTRHQQVKVDPARMRYDVGGRVVAIEGTPVSPRVSRWDEDRPSGAR